LQVLEFHENAERTYLKFLEDALVNLKVTDLMQPKFASVDASGSVQDALEQLAADTTDVVVVTDRVGKPVGLVERQHGVRAALENTPMSAPVTSIMAANPLTVSTTSGTDDVYAVMRYGTIDHLPVEEDNILVGLI